MTPGHLHEGLSRCVWFCSLLAQQLLGSRSSLGHGLWCEFPLLQKSRQLLQATQVAPGEFKRHFRSAHLHRAKLQHLAVASEEGEKPLELGYCGIPITGSPINLCGREAGGGIVLCDEERVA